MNNIELNHIDLNSIGLDSKQISGISKSYKHKIKPYIKGHVTDGSSSFTFKINNAGVTVPVDANGNWKWVQDRDITSLENMFYEVVNVDYVLLYGISGFTSMKYAFNANNYQDTTLELVEFRNCDFTKNTTMERCYRRRQGLKTIIGMDSTKHSSNKSLNCCFQYCSLLNLPTEFKWENFATNSIIDVLGCFMSVSNNENIDFHTATGITNSTSYFATSSSKLKTCYSFPVNNINFDANTYQSCGDLTDFNIDVLKKNLTLGHSSKLTEQSVVNIFNAVAADDIVLTFHQNVWNMIMREIDIQGSDIQVAYQNMIDNYDVTIANASFDAEIEYLESSGTQYIDTGFKANTTTTKIETQLQVTELGTTIGVMGSRNTVNATDTTACNIFLMANNKFRLDWIDGEGLNSYNNVVDSEKYTISMTRGLAIINGTEITATNTESINQDGNFLIFRFYRGTAPSPSSFKGRFYYFKIYSNNVLVRDFIPVRKGTTGYMYDKVSGNLFGNSGTGDFILGNDK